MHFMLKPESLKQSLVRAANAAIRRWAVRAVDIGQVRLIPAYKMAIPKARLTTTHPRLGSSRQP